MGVDNLFDLGGISFAVGRPRKGEAQQLPADGKRGLDCDLGVEMDQGGGRWILHAVKQRIVNGEKERKGLGWYYLRGGKGNPDTEDPLLVICKHNKKRGEE